MSEALMENMMTDLDAQAAARRVMARCDRLAAISETAGQLTRVYLSASSCQPAGGRVDAGCGDARVAGQRRQYLRPL
jgi:hypothetical protein